ncbi:MAG: tetratricopeptide repeat protein [Candidatus Omnitrophica bacterium]|nr:tetratricopeptide repeat protein [Candidatus Omnitrophota bacterium]
MTDKYRALDILEYVLGIITLVGLFIFVSLNMSYELRDPDIWLHLKTGEYIVQHKTIPSTDIFSSTLLNKQWIDHSWLVQVIFYLVFHFGGPDNLIFLSAIITTFAFLFLFLGVYEERKHLILVAGMLFLTILASKLRFNIRPENFSVLFFSLYIFILRKHLHSKACLFFLPMIQLIWVNSHGFFILGPLMAGVFTLAEKLKKSKLLPWDWAKTDLLDTASYKNLKTVFLLVCLVCFINPYGYKGALYPFWVSFTTIGKSGIFYKHIIELLPTWRFYKIIFSYYILIALSLAVFLLNLKTINIAYLTLWLFFLGISFNVNRNIVFFNFFAFLITADGLIKGFNVKKNNFIENLLGKPTRLLLYLLKYAIIVVLIFWLIRANQSLLFKRYYIFEENRVKGVLLGIAPGCYPEKAADFILHNNLPNNIFNEFNNGAYLIYRLFPKNKVFLDGRTELYGDDFFKNYQKILTVDKDTINDTFAKYNINTVLLTGIGLDTKDLSKYFFNNPNWTLVYFDESSLVFVKNNPQNRQLTDRLKIDLAKWQTQEIDIDKIGLKKVYPEPYVNRAWIFYYLGLNEQAQSEAKEALKILPSYADAYNIIGRAYFRQKLYDEAFRALRLASIYESDSPTTLISLGNFYMETEKFEDSLKIYKKLTKLNPRFAEAFHLLAQAYIQMKDTKSAVKSLRTAIKLDPFMANYYKELGELFEKDKDFKEADLVYKSAIDMGLDKTNFYSLLNNLRNKTDAKK